MPDDAATEPKTLILQRHFTRENEDVYAQVEWELRDVEIKDQKGNVVFAQRDVEVPKFWSQNATTIVASKYFRGHGVERETSVRQLIDRVVDTIAEYAEKTGYVDARSADILSDELRFLCLHQMMAFNSPVWFNVGTCEEPQCSACFIHNVDDNMESILDWWREEGLVFRGGSGAGVNISKLREKNAPLKNGGYASGPVSFSLPADYGAGAIKSGGKTRRAAKMVIMDDNHPDIEDFIQTKVTGERVARALIDAGFDPAFNAEGGAYEIAPWQNANHSVRLSDRFMRAVAGNDMFPLVSRYDGSVVREVSARAVFQKIAEAAWQCGDPGVQFEDTIQRAHTCPADGRIEATNPCAEYVFLNNTACNLASQNLMRFFDKATGTFRVADFIAALRVTYLAMDVIVGMSSYPTPKIGEQARRYRTLGMGFANLGALLMANGLAYDSDGGRAMAAAITSLMSAVGWQVSADIARTQGTFDGFDRNRESLLGVLRQHASATDRVGRDRLSVLAILTAADGAWQDAVARVIAHGARNAQVTVLAPTGTISFMMDCDTTGIEPDIALVKYKKLVGGGTMKIVNGTVELALSRLGYDAVTTDKIMAYVREHDTVEGCVLLRAEHLPVFDCSLQPAKGKRSISAEGHVAMMAACQPFLSGAISKTVNMPRTATVEDIAAIYTLAWKLGLKAVAVYRDGCKESQPLNVTEDAGVAKATAAPASRKRMPVDRRAEVHKFNLAGHEGYLTLGYYDDGKLGEIFVNIAKQGSTLSGLLDAWATMISIGLQSGIPLATIVDKFKHTSFEPSGFTGNPEVRHASSILDYIVRVMSQRQELGERTPGTREGLVEVDVIVSGPACLVCGAMTVRAGACFKCNNCGETTGCSG